MSRDTQRYYDGFSSRYSAERKQGYFAWVNEAELSVISDALPGKRVLEIGCGTGLILDGAREFQPASLAGVDLSPGMLRDAVASGHHVVCGSATALPFEDASFDVVYSFKVLPHVPDLAGALAEAVRVLAPGGAIYAELYNPWSWKTVLDWLRGARKRVYLRHDSPAAVRAAAPAGCQVECVAGIRIFGPFAGAYEGVAGPLVRALDRVAMLGPLRYLAGYQIHRIRRP